VVSPAELAYRCGLLALSFIACGAYLPAMASAGASVRTGGAVETSPSPPLNWPPSQPGARIRRRPGLEWTLNDA